MELWKLFPILCNSRIALRKIYNINISTSISCINKTNTYYLFLNDWSLNFIRKTNLFLCILEYCIQFWRVQNHLSFFFILRLMQDKKLIINRTRESRPKELGSNCWEKCVLAQVRPTLNPCVRNFRFGPTG